MYSRSRAAFALLCLASAVLVPAATASAATLEGAGALVYTAAPGHSNDVGFTRTAPGTVHVENFDADPITPSGTCASDGAGGFDCTGIATVVADGGDLGDFLDGTGLTDIPADLRGGTGSDEVDGGDADDILDGGDGDDFSFAGAGKDTMRGGNGSDLLDPGSGGGDVSGGADFDFIDMFVLGDPAPDVSVTLDDQPNDGTSGSGLNVHSDVEDVNVSSQDSADRPGNVTLVGSAGSNQLSVFFGRANITGGNGNDSLFGGTSDDTINSRDGFFDRVQCGAGTDTAVVDTLDAVAGDCESIQSQDVGNANEDKPPTVAFTSPAANAAKVGTRRPTTLSATATDDKGVAKVQFLDDERVVCEDTTAPYTCDYRPRGDDVGRNTLAAIAIDTAQQTATALRTVRVSRFAPRGVTLKVKPKRDSSNPRRFTASGKVNRPAGVSASQGCAGAVVAVQVKAGKTTISNRRTKLKSNCTYRQRVTFDDPGRLPSSGTLKFTARYQGNSIMTAKRSKAVRARTR